MPAVSVGNVGQFAVDLLLTTIDDILFCGYVNDETILPVIGLDPVANLSSNPCRLSTNCEVFVSEKHKLAIVQIRAPIIQGRQNEFASSLTSWIKEMKINKMIILSSSHSHERIDLQLIGSQFRYILSPSLVPELEDHFKNVLKWQKLEKKQLSSNEDDYRIPGGGYTKTLYEACNANNINTVVMLTFCSEGDNIPDALSLASHFNDWKNIIQKKETTSSPFDPWKVPVSWKLLFGNPAPKNMF